MALHLPAAALALPILAGMAVMVALTDKPVELSVGVAAPAFTLQNSEGRQVSLDQFRGKKVVLFFFPKDETPGCTAQVCALRDSFHRYQEEGIVLLGLNYATPAQHASFKEHHHLPFDLLSDERKEIAQKYGAYRGFFRWFAPARMTFVIDEKGLIKAVLKDVNVTTHADQIVELCRQ